MYIVVVEVITMHKEQYQRTFGLMSESDRRLAVDRTNPACPLSEFIGNEDAVARLSRAAYIALGNETHQVKRSFAFLGMASCGKTLLARLFGRTINLPFIEISPKAVRNINDVVTKINEVLSVSYTWTGERNASGKRVGYDLSLEAVRDEDGNETNRLVIPPCIVFFDEVHALSDAIVQGLLKATEPNDAMLQTDKWNIDCSNVCFMIATTDRGRLFDAFDTRFTKIFLNPYNAKEMAKIVSYEHPLHPRVCALIAKYGGRIPREVLQFANDVVDEHAMNNGKWDEIVRKVAKEWGKDELGMSSQHLKILVALSNGPISKGRLSDIIGCKEEELENFIMPELLICTDDQPALVSVNSKGFSISEAGLEQLAVRGIKCKPAA
jgi:Holliday junction resolvasome RuvABC ATP-dependent DNA helicase subunit